MENSLKKSFMVKYHSLERTLKQYNSYKNEVNSYDMNDVSQNKKKTQFYEESLKALQMVGKKVQQFGLQLNSFITENEEQLQNQQSVKESYGKAKETLNTIKQLFPATF